MTGEVDLVLLLNNISPKLSDEVFVFASAPNSAAFQTLSPLMIYREDEGASAILEMPKAQRAGLEFSFPCRRITLEVHSALEAVGLITTVSERLTIEEIPCNVVSAYFHDHIFVPVDMAERALKAIKSLAEGVPDTE